PGDCAVDPFVICNTVSAVVRSVDVGVWSTQELFVLGLCECVCPANDNGCPGPSLLCEHIVDDGNAIKARDAVFWQNCEMCPGLVVRRLAGDFQGLPHAGELRFLSTCHALERLPVR